MVRSRLPVPSLLGLFGALQMLFPEVLMGNPERLSDVPFTDDDVQKAFKFSVEQYNQVIGCPNYFKQLQLLQALTQGDTREVYHLKVELVITACKKKPGRRMKYKRIQKCQQLPGDPEKRICHFKVSPRLPPKEIFEYVVCGISLPPKDLFCSG